VYWVCELEPSLTLRSASPKSTVSIQRCADLLAASPKLTLSIRPLLNLGLGDRLL
jgi:hypothetical protein